MQDFSSNDTLFIIYFLITVLLVLISILILLKSRSRINLYFSITPIFFSLILVFNMINLLEEGLISEFPLWIPYLLAPLGILFAGWYIHYGKEMYHIRGILVFSLLWIIFSFLSSLYLEFASDDSGYLEAINHFMLIFPLSWSVLVFYKIRLIIPDQRPKILALSFGLIIVIVGTFLRSIRIFLDALNMVGLVIIIFGTVLVLISFLLQPTVKESR